MDRLVCRICCRGGAVAPDHLYALCCLLVDLALIRCRRSLTGEVELAREASLGQPRIKTADGKIQTEHTYGQDPRNIPG